MGKESAPESFPSRQEKRHGGPNLAFPLRRRTFSTILRRNVDLELGIEHDAAEEPFRDHVSK